MTNTAKVIRSHPEKVKKVPALAAPAGLSPEDVIPLDDADFNDF